MTVDPEKFAAALASALAPVVPPELQLSVDGSRLRLAIAGTPWWSAADRLDDADVTDWTVDVLNGFQTDIAEVTTEPWPATAPAPMPEPFAEIHGDDLVCGYGEPSAPFLQLATIRLEDVG